MDEMITKVVDDNDAFNEVPLYTEISQVVTIIGGEAALDKTKTGEHNESKEMEEESASDDQLKNIKMNAIETMKKAFAMVEAGDDLDRDEINEAGIEDRKPAQMVGEEAVEDQVVEDRTEDQVPDITGTDNADVMATSMDSIDELPTSEEQAVDMSALAEQEIKPPAESETDNVTLAPFTEAEAPSEEEIIAVGPELETPNEVDDTETAHEEISAEEIKAIGIEASQDSKTKQLPTEQNAAVSEAKTKKLEMEELEDAQPEVEQAQDELIHMEPLEVTEVIQEVITEQSLATNESEAIVDELSEAGAEEKNNEDFDNERNESDNVELLNEEQQPKVWSEEAEESSIASALPPEEKSETNQSSPTSSFKFEEKNDGPVTTPFMADQEFTFDEGKSSFKKSITDDKVLSRKSTVEEKIPSRKTSAMREEVPSRKVSTMEEKFQEVPSRKVSTVQGKIQSRETSVVEDEKPQSRKTSEVKEKNVPSRKSSAIQEAKTQSRKTSETDEKVSSRKASFVEEEKVPSRKSSATQERVPTRKISSEMEEKAPSRKSSKMVSVEEENSEKKEFSPEPAGAQQSVRAGRKKISKTEVIGSEVEPELEPITGPESAAEENVVEAGETEIIAEIPTEKLNNEVSIEDATAEDVKDEVERVPEAEKDKETEKYTAFDEQESLPSTRQIISPPSRRRSPSPSRKRQERSPSPVRRETFRGSTYSSYDQDFRSNTHPETSHQDNHRQRGPPPHMPSYLSFSSYTPVEKKTYSPISPWVQNTAQKYRNDYTAVSTYKPPSMYTSIFDDIVSSGPFSSNLYSANRLLERSRSRSRELRNALRSKRSTSNYYRYTSKYATTPLRTRDYSTPPLSSIGRSSSGSGSFISFMEYSAQKQNELARSSSRLSTHEGLSRASSRSNIDMFYDTERLSRVDSYVRDLNRDTEYGFPSTYAKYRSPSRPYSPLEYTPINGYRAYNSSLRPSVHTNTYTYNPISVSHNLYENRIADLQRSLSREKLARERMKAKYKTLSNKLDQACRQMDLLRTSSYSSIRGGTGTYSVYNHNYPYF